MICPSNHVTCGQCYQAASTHQAPLLCSSCNLRLQQHSNSGLLANLLDNVRRACTWAANGCNYVAALKDMKKHEENCLLQSVQCETCNNFFPFSTFHHHDLNCFHQQKIFSSPLSLILDISQAQAQPIQIATTYQGEVFYVRIKRIATRAVWLIYVVCQMVSQDCSNFKVDLMVSSSGKEQSSSFSISGKPSSIVSSENVLKSGNCLVLTEPAMKILTYSSEPLVVALNISKA